MNKDYTYPVPEKQSFDSGGIYSVYQPIIDISNRTIFAYEALTRGLSSIRQPQELFRKAYELGDAVDFDIQCLTNILKNFPKIEKHQLLFINIEPVTLGYAIKKNKAVHKILQKLKSSAQQIVFEMTEGMKRRDFDQVKQGYLFLKKHHCKFALDDVDGVDSKLLKLLTLKPDYLKIDMGLIQNITSNALHQKLVSQIIELGNKKNFHIIAEGIENEKDFNIVRKLGIRYVQGYLFARPEKKLLKRIKNPHL